MNILMVHPHDIYSSSEPWTVRIVYIAKEFVKKGHRVRLVYCPLRWDKQAPAKLQKGIVAIPISRKHGPQVFLFNILKLCILAKWADVIHFQKCFYYTAMPAITAAFLRKKPIHYDWDDWETKIYEVSTRPGILRNVIRNFLNVLEAAIPQVADTVSVASQGLRAQCEKIISDQGRLFDAHVGADIAKFRPDISGEFVRKKYNIANPLVLYLGQLHGGQYAELFIKAAAELINGYRKNLSFMIVGDGYLAEELKKIAYALKLEARLIFTGAVAHDSIPQYIAAADICVACFEENDVTICKSPLKIVEYLASAKAIIASDVGEVPNMIREAGILVRPGDFRSLAGGIIRVLEDGHLKNKLERSARKRAEEKYNWAVTAQNLLNAYKKAIRLNDHKSR